MRNLAWLVLVAAPLAHAGPVDVTVAASGRATASKLADVEDGGNERETSGDAGYAALSVAVMAKLPWQLAVGVRAAIGTPRTGDTGEDGNMRSEDFHYTELPIDAGVAVRRTFGALWVAPWVGVHAARRTEQETVCTYNAMQLFGCETREETGTWRTNRLAVGLTAGVDLARTGAHRFGLVLDAQTGYQYTSFGVGVAWRR